ncbi:MAG: MaoC/PaaZ C-terminal domain-containing protein [Gammaproteobacteria bacterium]
MTARELPRFAAVAVGDALPALALPAVTRVALAIYCGASGDHNPVHVDSDFARAAGLDDVITHGMLVMAWTGRVLTDWAPPAAIRSFDTRFLAVTRIGDAITARKVITEKFELGDEHRVRIALEAVDQHGEAKTRGSAVVALG